MRLLDRERTGPGENASQIGAVSAEPYLRTGGR
jgi:hypothetical protein